MSDKMKIKQAIVVEGRYDKAKLTSLVDALVIPTHGFSIFTDTETKDFIRKIAKQRGIIVLTDSDGAGFKIRGFLQGIVPKEEIINVYIPDILGKEKRKKEPSKEGKLGVEGMTIVALKEAFAKAGVFDDRITEQKSSITQMDLYRDGFYGRADSSSRRERLYRKLGLPQRLSTKQAVALLCSMLTKEEYDKLVDGILEKEE